MRENGCIIHSSILPLAKRIGFTGEDLVLRIVEGGYLCIGIAHSNLFLSMHIVPRHRSQANLKPFMFS